tara:strand:- start:442 stop:555 length:114 start_codon:yes stop_codon:yes gene_type:complete
MVEFALSMCGLVQHFNACFGVEKERGIKGAHMTAGSP